MTIQLSQQTWEYQLLTWAQEAFQSQPSEQQLESDHHSLQAEYAYCAALTRTHSRTFFMASGLLPTQKRQAARALYAFCRITDDMIDSDAPIESRKQALADWQSIITDTRLSSSDPVALAWADTRSRFNIPSGYAEQLISGVTRDLDQARYQTFDELAEYAYGVASTVGLMSMHIIGFSGEEALPYAVKLGVALQLTNILRDVAEDWQSGRLYLPLEELHRFGLVEHDIAIGTVDDRWRNFLRFQIERNRKLYAESWPGIAMLKSDGRFAIATAAKLYQAILTDIERHDYNVFNRRAHINLLGKVSRLPHIWWHNRKLA